MGKEIAIDKLTIGSKLTSREVNSEDILIKQDDGSYVSVKGVLSKLPSAWIKSVNKVDADANGDISLNNDLLIQITDFPEFRTAAFGNGIYVASKKRSGLVWSEDGKTFTNCTLNGGSFGAEDIRLVKFLGGKFIAIENTTYGTSTVKVYSSADGKSWKTTKEIPSVTDGYFNEGMKYSLVHDGKRFLITGEDVSFPTSTTYPCDKTYAFLYTSVDGENWSPISLTYNAKERYDIPFASNLARLGNGFVAVKRHFSSKPEKKYAYFELTDDNQIVNLTEFSSTASGVGVTTEPWAAYGCNDYALIGYANGITVKITKSGSAFNDELLSPYEASFGIARSFCEYDNSIFAASYNGKIIKIAKDLSACDVVYSTSGEFNGAFIDDRGVCVAGYENVDGKECGQIVRYSNSEISHVTAIASKVNDFIKALTPATTADESITLINSILTVLKVMKFA